MSQRTLPWHQRHIHELFCSSCQIGYYLVDDAPKGSESQEDVKQKVLGNLLEKMRDAPQECAHIKDAWHRNHNGSEEPSDSSTLDALTLVRHDSPLVGRDSQNANQPRILIKPTYGFETYQPYQSFLHCGYADAMSVVHFLHKGVRREQVWESALEIVLEKEQTNSDSSDEKKWSAFLNLFEIQEKSRSQKYHDLNNNCFDFLVRGWNQWHEQQNKSDVKLYDDKFLFAQDILEARTEFMEAWLKLYKSVEASKEGFVVRKLAEKADDDEKKE